MGLPSYSGALAVSLINSSTCVGFLLQGQLVDRFHPALAIFISTVGAIVSVFIFWGLGKDQAMLYTFSILWGLSGNSFPGNWTGCAKDMRRFCETVDIKFVLSLMCAGRGIGTVTSGPISALLLQIRPETAANLAYNSQYGPMILFTGFGVTLGGAGCVASILYRR